jgi:hypothetical protein
MHELPEPKCLPVSLNQRRLWIIDHLQSNSAPYHIPVCLRLTGPLALGALKRSIDAIVARHESLRTIFGVQDGAPVQLIRPSCVIPLQVRDISVGSDRDLEARAYSFVRQEIDAPFDLGKGPLIRTALLRLGPEHHILISIMHHIVSDGWSAELFVRELAEHYDAFTGGREPSLKPLPMQYSDFTILQRHSLASKPIGQQLSFWQRTLAGVPLLHNLPCDRARPERPTFAGASLTLRLDDKLVADLHQFARQQRVTVFMLLTAAFQVMLSKYSGQQDVLIGIPVSGRAVVEAESLIGLFVNSIVLRTSLSGDPPFIEILNQVRENLLNAMAHQDVPFEQIVDAVGASRRLDHNPLFQIMFATFRAAVQSRAFGQLIATPYVVESTTSRFDLSVNIIEGIEGVWWLQAEYSTELFDRPRVANMLETYRMLLWSILTDGYQRLSHLRLSQEEAPVSSPQPNSSAIAPKVPTAPSIARSRTSRQNEARASTGPTSGLPNAVPSDHVERRLAKIWQKYLRMSAMNFNADFFEMGGNSLLAIAVMAEVNRTFGKRLPVAALFHDGTIRRLAARVREQRTSQMSFLPLVEAGTKPPLFVGGSSYDEFRDLSRALGPDQPFYQMDIYALQEERLIAQRPLFTTVEDMATHFIHEINSVQRSGPYFLAGQCEGGILALEVARQLQQQGREIAVLMQLDTPVTGYFRSPAAPADDDRVAPRRPSEDTFAVFVLAASPPVELGQDNSAGKACLERNLGCGSRLWQPQSIRWRNNVVSG